MLETGRMCWKTEGKLELIIARTALCQRVAAAAAAGLDLVWFRGVPSCSTINRIESECLLYPAERMISNPTYLGVSRRISAAPGDCGAGQASSTRYGKDAYGVVRCVVLLLPWNVMCVLVVPRKRFA